jgi:hypothetical protein
MIAHDFRFICYPQVFISGASDPVRSWLAGFAIVQDKGKGASHVRALNPTAAGLFLDV